jgi:hypothetical protein
MAASENGRTNGLYTYDSFSGSGSKKPTESHFLWWCAGAYQPLLKECPSEQTKYAGLGGVILATFVLAALSAGYAVYSVFDSILPACGFGIIWGLIIFNFDRFLVATMRKYGVSRRRQVWIAMPRVLLALLIGITIARPLELKIFEKEIDVQVAENRHKKILLNDSLLQAENLPLLSAAQQERGRLAVRKSGLEDTLHRLQQDYVREADGTGGSHRRGIDQLTRLKQEAYSAALQRSTPELQQLDQQIRYQDSLIRNANAGKETRRNQYEAQVRSDVGFLERNRALSDLSAREGSVFWANLLISLLIILIECGPVLSKLIMSTSPYDLALAKMELSQMAHSESEMRRDQELLLEKTKRVFEQKKKTTDELVDKISELQKKHIGEELEQWEKGEGRPVPARTALDKTIRDIKERYDYREEDII